MEGAGAVVLARGATGAVTSRRGARDAGECRARGTGPRGGGAGVTGLGLTSSDIGMPSGERIAR